MESKVIVIGNFYNHGTGYAGNVFDKGGLCPTLTNMQGGGSAADDYLLKKTEQNAIKNHLLLCCRSIRKLWNETKYKDFQND